MKKVLCTVTNDLTYDQRMIRICTSLAKAGYDVTLVGRHISSSNALIEQPFHQQRLHLFIEKGKLFYLEMNLRLFLKLLFSKFDIVHAVDLDTLLPGFLVARLRRKICVYDAHEFFTEVPEVVGRPAVQKIWRTLGQLIIPRLKFAITVNRSLANVFEKEYGVPFEVIRNVPVSLLEVETQFHKKKSPFIVLYQGVLNEGRGLEEAIEAMMLLENAELWLAGEGDLSKELRRLAQIKGVDSKVKFLGKIPPPELAMLTLQAHVGLNLLKNKGLNYYYSLANKSFDYMRAGLPSINMNFPEYRSINQDNEVFLLLETIEPAGIADAVNLLRSDIGLYKKLAANCQKAAAIYNWENEEIKLLAFYQKLEQPASILTN